MQAGSDRGSLLLTASGMQTSRQLHSLLLLMLPVSLLSWLWYLWLGFCVVSKPAATT
jgi:hypothetical protein